MKGLIALDIDGTITTESLTVPPRVVAYLRQLCDQGWQLCFLTGRTFSFASKLLKQLPFHCILAAYNGALVTRLPSEEVLARHYLDRSVFQPLEEISQGLHHDYVLYAGHEHQDQCYYRPHRFNPDLLDYAHRRQVKKQESWLGVESFDQLKLDSFPSVKYFGLHHDLVPLCHTIEERLGLRAPFVTDALIDGHCIVQITHHKASKGEALRLIADLYGADLVIAAGDDDNDRSMIEVADVKIVMNDAPSNLLALADIVAPPATAQGIVEGLSMAIAQC